jgi:hypothetical protein
MNDNKPDYELRTMDCVDCHNRAAHSLSLRAAVDQSLAEGRIDPRCRRFAAAPQLIQAGYDSPELPSRKSPSRCGPLPAQHPDGLPLWRSIARPR